MVDELPDAERTGEQAVAAAWDSLGVDVMPDSGLCLQYVRGDFLIPAWYASAIDAWNAAHDRHDGDQDPPAGVPYWFDSTSIYGHVAFHLGAGRFATTYNDDVRDLSWQDMRAIYGPPMGWAGSLNEHDVIPDVAPTPEPEPEDDDMRPMFLRRKDGAMVVIAGNGAKPLSFDHWQVWQNLGYHVTHDEMDPGPFDALIEDLGGWAP